MASAEKLNIENLPDCGIFEPGIFLEGQKILFVLDVKPEAVCIDICNLNV